MTFEEMAQLMAKAPARMRRKGWAELKLGDGTIAGSMWIEQRFDEEHRPFAVLMIQYPERIIQAPRWTATATDKGATDWEEVDADHVPLVPASE